jgi:hypothetical protein
VTYVTPDDRSPDSRLSEGVSLSISGKKEEIQGLRLDGVITNKRLMYVSLGTDGWLWSSDLSCTVSLT